MQEAVEEGPDSVPSRELSWEELQELLAAGVIRPLPKDKTS